MEMPSQIYEVWTPETDDPIPPRSQIYSPAPIGIGTPEIESLTSYMSRLANAHCLTVGSMFNWGPVRGAPDAVIKHLVPYSYRIDGRKDNALHHTSSSINGVGIHTKGWVKTLETLTRRKNLWLLTMLPLGDVLRDLDLLKSHHAWCPVCYESDQGHHGPYDRLVWSLKPLALCPTHFVRLVEHCHSCKKRSARLASRSLPGYCSHCGVWLGGMVVNRTKSVEEVTISNQLNDLIGTINATDGLIISSEFPREWFVDNLWRMAEHFTGGNQAAFARKIGLPVHILKGLLQSQHAPTIENILQIGSRIGSSISRFLLRPLFDVAMGYPHIQRDNTTLPRRQNRSRTTEEVRRYMLEVLTSDECPTVNELGRRLGYVNGWRLYQIDGDVCGQLTRKRGHMDAEKGIRKESKKRSDAEVKAAMESSLRMERPDCVNVIAASLGYSSGGAIRQRFQKLAAAIIGKRRKWDLAEKQRVKKLLKAFLREVPPPTVAQVVRRAEIPPNWRFDLHFPGFLRELKKARLAYRGKKSESLRPRLLQALDEEPAPAFSALAASLGMPVSTLSDWFPDLAKRITARSRANLKKNRPASSSPASLPVA